MKHDAATQPDLSAEDEELLRYLAEIENGQSGARAPALVRRPAGEDAPLSFGQQRLWLLDQIEGDNSALHLALALRLRGPLDRRALGEALDAVVARHEVLRTRFVMKDLEPAQQVLPSLSLELPLTDLIDAPSDEQTKGLENAMRALMCTPFDLAAPPLIRARLLRLGPEEHSLMLVLHHAVTDRWSLMLLLGELVHLYTALAAGDPPSLPELPVQYGDYALWERKRLKAERLNQLLGYWRGQLAALEPIELPLDHVRPAVQTFAGATESIVLPRAALHSLDRLARASGCTRFMALLAVFVAVLQRYSGQTDVVVGTPISNRNVPELERLVGFFLNTLVLRVDSSGDPSFAELLERVRRTTLDAYAHQDMPFERIVQDLNPRRDLSRSPLFQVLFVQLDQALSARDRDGTAAASIEAGDITVDAERFGRDAVETLRHDLVESTQYDLEAYVGEIAEGLLVRFVYNVALFEAETMRRMLGHFRQVLERSTQSVDRRLADLTVLGDDERRLLLRNWNATAREIPDACVPALIAAQAARTPQAVAIQAADGALSYAQLQARAAALASRLEALGVGVGDRVAVCVERTLDLPVSLLGVMASGAAYVPLDPGFPDERLRYMVDDARASVVVTQARLEREWPGRTVLDLDVEGEALWSTARPGPAHEPRPRDLTYVIYTSGSTGRPKGVCIEHGALVNFLWSMRERPGLNAQDVLVSVTTLSFDIFGLELFLPLLVGARVVLASRDDAMNGAVLARLLETSGASVMQATPATWRMLVESGWRGRKQLKALCGGEALSPALVVQFAGRVGSLWNLYGPTETTVWSTVEQIEASSLGATVSIGRPIANTRVYVLDERLQPVPAGVSGELWIGGRGVGRGYWERPELTAERFVADPFADEPGARMYRTGDLARWRRDGRLEHLGRLDQQVKLRGYRIELGEIEAVLEGREGVDQAVVISRKLADDVRLVAYVVGKAREARALDAYVREHLPGYMVPSVWVFLEQLPLTPNGKLDRRALPAPGAERQVQTEYSAPRTPTEKTVADIWAEVLGIERVGVHDNFFDLGGHSLLVVKVIERIRQRTGVTLSPMEYMMQNLHQIASLYDERQSLAQEVACTTRVSRSAAAASFEAVRSPKSKLDPDVLSVAPSAKQPRRGRAGDVEYAPAADVQAFYFGRGGSPLFGCFHPAHVAVGERSALVVCQPFGQEYIRCHRLFRVLSASLARSGLPVFRFDYYGCGDSQGDGEDATLAQCIADVGEAVRFVRERTGAASIDLLGLRLGATIALRFAADRPSEIRRVVLWDPIVHGEDFLASMREQSARFKKWMRGVFRRAAGPNEVDGPRDFIGFRFSQTIIDELSVLDLLKLSESPCERALVLDNGKDHAAATLHGHLNAIGVRADFERLASPRIWLAEPYQGIVPRDSLELLSRWLLESDT